MQQNGNSMPKKKNSGEGYVGDRDGGDPPSFNLRSMYTLQ